MTQFAKDITDAEFQTAVIDRSREIPVVVDLWAPWCGPCRQLGPVLEDVAEARQGEFELVKINVDENPVSAQQLGARSIPLVVAFRNGAVASQFVGAQPRSAVMKFIDSLMPTKTDQLIAAATSARQAGDMAQAEQYLNEALSEDRQHKGARLELAELLVALERYEEALAALQALPAKPDDAVGRLMAEIRTKMAGDVDIADLKQRVDANPDDLDAAISLGQALGAERRFEPALDVLLDAVRRNPSYKDGMARQKVIDLLAVMGPDNPQTREYRQKLARAIH